VVILLIIVAINLLGGGGPTPRDKDKGKVQPGAVGGGGADNPQKIDIDTAPPEFGRTPPDLGVGTKSDPPETVKADPIERPTIVENQPEPPARPAEEVVSLFSERLAGWQQEGSGWSSAAGTAVGEHAADATRLAARTPSAGFDLTIQVAAISADSAGLEFQHGSGGICRLTITPKGFLRLQRVHDRGIDQLGFKGLSAGAHKLRVIAQGRLIDVYADGVRVIRVPDAPPADAAEPRLTLLSVKGRAEFSAARWAPLGGDARRATLTALARFNDATAVPQLRRTLADKASNPALAADAVRMLQQFSDPKAVEAVRQFAARDDVAVEPLRAAVAALGTVGGEIALVEKRMTHADAGVRAAAAISLAKLSADSAAKIMPLLNDREPEVRRAVIAAFSRLRAEAALPALSTALRDPSLRGEATAVLLDLAESADGWMVLEPILAESLWGVKFAFKDDGSMLAGGADPDTDVYTVSFRCPLRKVTALRLELLTDGAMPHGGPGRADNGNIVLNELKAFAASAAGGPGKPIAFKRAFADREQNDFKAEHAIDNDPKTGWAIASWEHHRPCSLFLETAEDVGFPEGTIITLRLEQHFGGKHTIGRLRLRAAEIARPIPPARTGLDPARLIAQPVLAEAVVAGLLLEDSVRRRCVEAIRRGLPETLAPLVAAGKAGRLNPAHAAVLRAGLSDPVPVRSLHLCGPFATDTAKDYINVAEFSKNPDHKRKYPGAGREAEWRKADADGGGRIDLRGFYGSDQKWSAYGHFTVDAPIAGDTECKFECDDELTVWVNGERAGVGRIGGERTVPVRLNKGVNHVVFRVDNDGGGDWWYRLSIGRTGLPVEVARPPLIALFEDDGYLIPLLSKDVGRITLETGDRFSGAAFLRVGVPQRHNEWVANWWFPIAENPAAREYRYMRFAWRKRGGVKCALQLCVEGQWEKDGKGWRFFAGRDSPWPSAKVLGGAIPEQWQVHTIDLFKEFGPIKISGIAISPLDGDYMDVDQVYLAKSLDDLKALGK
jgi:hypothetical protein